jgi:glucokinase
MTNDPLRYAIGVDLGGTKIEVGIVDETGRIHQHQRLKTLALQGPQAIERQIIESIHGLQQEMAVSLSGIGIGAAGQIHPQSGEVIFSPNLNWHHVPLQANIEKTFHLPVRIVNDVRAITLGEWQYGAGQDCNELLCLFVGTGIGAGVVSGGRLLTGCSNTFGELGHITIDFNGSFCTCGKRGCLESFAGGWGIAARAQKAIELDEKRHRSQMLLNLAGGQLNQVTAKIVVQAYHEGDEIAKSVIEQARTALIAGVASLVNAFNPCRIILGGGLIDGLPEFVDAIDKGVREIALKAATQSLEITKPKLGKEVGVIGSAAAIFKLLKEEPFPL